MKEVRLPELAESVVEGEILKWLVAEGDVIVLEQPLCEVMTDKVTVELPSPVAGTLHQRLANEGDVVAVHAVIALIDESGTGAPAAVEAPARVPEERGPEDGETDPPQGSIVEAGHLAGKVDDDASSLFRAFASDESVRVQGLTAREATPPSPAQAAPQAAPREDGRVLAVPAARQLARERNIDLSLVPGSGPNGRVRVQDVLDYQPGAANPAPAVAQPAPAQAGTGASSPAASAPAARPAGSWPVPPVPYRTPRGYESLEERVPLRGMRRAISNQMIASHLYTVRTLTVDEVNLTRLVELRERVKADAQAAGVKLSYLPFIFRAIAVALRKYPSLNSSFDEATQEIVLKRYFNIGMAVATDAGLTVPVLRDVERKSIFDLAREVTDLAGRAQAGKLQADELSGSSFSVTNIGSIGALFSFPIINVPDAAILGVHSIVKRPVVNEQGEIVAAHMMYLSLSFDHRLVDGADAARFCREIIRLLENPDRLLVEAL